MSSSSAQSSQRRAGRAGRLVRTLLLLAVLAPACLLFVNVYDTAAAEESSATRERHGVEYLTSLWRLTLVLTDTQSAIVAGRAPADPAILGRAVAETGQVDERLGDELRTRDRWSGLRAKIEALPQAPVADASAAYTGYTEASELLLALIARVREYSGLIRDAQADAYFLADAVARQLPATTTAAGRLADLTLLAPTRPRSEQINTIARLTVVRTAMTDPAEDLAEDLRSAVDGSQRRTLSDNLLRRLDLFQRAMDAYAAASAPAATEVVPDFAPVGGARAELQSAAAELGSAILVELDGLLAGRLAGAEREQWYARGTLAAAVLLVLVLIALVYRPRPPARPRDEPPSTEPAEAQPAAGAVRRPLVTTSAGPGLAAGPAGPGAAAGRDAPAGWGRSGAAR
jgi:hypothetical protein